MITAVQRIRHRERGAVALEFAIIAPVVLLLIMGIIDFGRAFYVKQALLNGASQAARAAALGTTNTTTLTTVARTATPNIRGLAGAGSDLTLPTVTGTCPTTGAQNTDSKTVTAQITFKWMTPLAWFQAAGEGSNSQSTISATASWLCVNRS